MPGEERRKIRILLADGHRMVRQGIRRIFEAEPDLEVVGEADDGNQTVKLARELRPDVIVMEARMGKQDSVETVKRVRAQNPEAAILVLTALENEEYIGDMLRAGAGGCLLKSDDADKLVKSIPFLRAGVFVCDSTVEQRILTQAVRPRKTVVNAAEHLTRRELEVLRLAAKGITNTAIAAELGVGPRTVKQHLANVYGKMHVASRTEAALKAMQNGWLIPGRD